MYNTNLNLNYKFGTYSSLQLVSGQLRRVDRFEPKRFDYEELFSRLEYRSRFFHRRVNYSMFFQYGNNQNYLIQDVDNISDSYFTGFNLSVPILYGFTGRIGTLYQNTKRYSSDRSANTTVNMGLSWAYGSKFSINTSYRNRYDIEDYFLTQDQFSMNMRYSPVGNHRFDLSVTYAKPRGNVSTKNLFISAKYTYRFDLSNKNRKSRGRINGRVMTEDSLGIKRAVLRISTNEVVSDEDGFFQFSRLPNGTYFVNLTRSSLGINQITEKKMPVKVVISDNNKSPYIDIKIVEACKIHGQIQYPKVKNSLLDKESKNKRPVYIEISNGVERHIAPSDSTGSFSFDYLRPGKWNVRLIETTLDEDFIYTRTKTTIEVKPGEAKKLLFKARRKQKQLRMIGTPVKLSAKSRSSVNGSR